MASATAVLYGVDNVGGRVVSSGFCRRALRFLATNIVLAVAAVATVALFGTAVTLAAAWIVNSTFIGSERTHATRTIGPAALAWVRPDPNRARDSDAAFKAKWAQTAALIVVPQPVPVPQSAAIETVKLAPPVTPARLQRDIVPIPRQHPAELQRPPADKPAIKLALAPPDAKIKEPVLAEADRRTALYDISAKVVYMPNGDKLEAHSGLGDKRDDPRFTKIRMRGATPPNVYDLTERERLFHGVRAIRLNPVDEGKMFGRDGMLAHTYMLGPNGQSNGCVSFKDYRKFLTAFLNGEVNRLVVVSDLGKTPWRVAVAQHSHVKRYAANY